MQILLKYKKNHLQIRRFFLLITLLVIVFSIIYKIPGESRDFLNYQVLFDNLRYQGLGFYDESRIEIGFLIIAKLLSFAFNDDLYILGGLAAISLCIKFFVLNKLSPTLFSFIFIIFFYLIRFAPLHEMTQIRLAFSLALIFVALLFFSENKKFYGVALCLMAPFFHISTLLISAAILVSQVKFFDIEHMSFLKFILIPFLIFAFVSLMTNNIINDYAIVGSLLDIYLTQGFGDVDANPLGISLLVDLFFIAIILIMWKKLSPVIKYSIFMILIGLAIFYGAIAFPVIAHRFRELFSVFWIFFIVGALSSRGNVKNLSYLILTCNISIYSYLYFFKGDFFI